MSPAVRLPSPLQAIIPRFRAARTAQTLTIQTADIILQQEKEQAIHLT
jgi:hypothetical protein